MAKSSGRHADGDVAAFGRGAKSSLLLGRVPLPKATKKMRSSRIFSRI